MMRDEILKSIRQTPNVSVLIIGGGINGVGAFRDLALQGVNVLLVDKGDFCSGASAASSHMVHGGIRYLENGEFRLVREAVQERNRLLQNAPHYVKPLATTIPIFKWFSGLFNAPLKFLGLLNKPAERGALVIKAGLMMYDAYTRAQGTVPKHGFAWRKKSLERYPDLNPDILCTATYYDAAMPSPERICLELVLDAEAASPQAKAINYVSAEGCEGDEVILRDGLTGEPLRVHPELVINAAGPWIDFANRALGQETHFIGGTKGSHLVLDHAALRAAIGDHEFFFENEDGRIVLIYPFLDKIIVGTSDIHIDDPETARCTAEEIDYFLGMLKKVFPGLAVDRSHIVFHFSGVRPLPASDATTTGQISRDHSIRIIEPEAKTGSPFPIFSLISGKWTTFRAFSEQTTDLVLSRLGMTRKCNTTALPIGGGRDYPHTETEQADWLSTWQSKVDLPRARLKTLFDRYGTRAEEIAAFSVADPDGAAVSDEALGHHPQYSRREIIFLSRYEKIVHLDDLLLRRSLLGMLGELTPGLIEELAGVVGQALAWSDQRQHAEVERVLTLLAEQHGVVFDHGGQGT